MTDAELQALVEQWSLRYFDRPFTHRAYFNRRLKTTGGRYHLQSHNIDINPLMLTEHDMATLKGVVLHELCHYHLHLTGRGYQHRDRDFKQLLATVGGSRYAPASRHRRRARHRYYYRCRGCGAVIVRQRRFNVWHYHCARCGSRFQLVKTLFMGK